MTFRQKYDALECKFEQQVERDNKKPSIESIYLPNFIPKGSADYILIAMEPSTGVPGKDHAKPRQVARNFSWSVEDFILHYSIRKWLCRDGHSYHLTDLAKGGMMTKLADKDRRLRYERWYPLLKEELQLLNKRQQTRIISIGKEVSDFLQKKSLCDSVERILHYSRNAAGHRDRAIASWRESFSEFSSSVDEDDFQESIMQVLTDADMDGYIGIRPEGDGRHALTESRKKLMFHYKKRFSELRDASHIILKL